MIEDKYNKSRNTCMYYRKIDFDMNKKSYQPICLFFKALKNDKELTL